MTDSNGSSGKESQWAFHKFGALFACSSSQGPFFHFTTVLGASVSPLSLATGKYEVFVVHTFQIGAACSPSKPLTEHKQGSNGTDIVKLKKPQKTVFRQSENAQSKAVKSSLSK